MLEMQKQAIKFYFYTRGLARLAFTIAVAETICRLFFGGSLPTYVVSVMLIGVSVGSAILRDFYIQEVKMIQETSE